MTEIFNSPDLIIQEYTVGTLQTHCYFLINPATQDLIIIDPGDDGDFLSEQILAQGLNLRAILLTHGHFDHAGGTLPLRLNFPTAALILPEKDHDLYSRGNGSADYFGLEIDPLAPPTHLVKINKTTHQAKFSPDLDLLPAWQWFFVPGHTPGHLALYHPRHHLLISGDTIFTGGLLGRTDFHYADLQLLQTAIKKNLLPLPEDTVVFPGHEDYFVLDKNYREFLTANF